MTGACIQAHALQPCLASWLAVSIPLHSCAVAALHCVAAGSSTACCVCRCLQYFTFCFSWRTRYVRCSPTCLLPDSRHPLQPPPPAPCFHLPKTTPDQTFSISLKILKIPKNGIHTPMLTCGQVQAPAWQICGAPNGWAQGAHHSGR